MIQNTCPRNLQAPSHTEKRNVGLMCFLVFFSFYSDMNNLFAMTLSLAPDDNTQCHVVLTRLDFLSLD